MAEGEAETDAMGRFLIELDADLGEKVRSQTYTIEAQVIDESDQLVAGRTPVIVHQGLVYVGLQPEDYVGRAERENVINLLAVDWDSEPVAGQEVEYEVVERRWFSVQEEDEMGRTVWTWDVEEVPVEGASGTVTTDEDGRRRSLTPPVGASTAYATTTDERGNTVTSCAFVWSAARTSSIGGRRTQPHPVDHRQDRLQRGRHRRDLIQPVASTAAALTVERAISQPREVIRLDTNSTVYRLPIGRHAPGIFVSVLLSKGVDENNPNAAFRMGFAQLNVDAASSC